MEDFVSDSKWLNFLAADLSYKQFPEATAARLKIIAQIIDTHDASVRATEEELLNVRREVEKLTSALRIASADLEQMWLRYKMCVTELSRHDAERAESFAAYRPALLDAFKPMSA